MLRHSYRKFNDREGYLNSDLHQNDMLQSAKIRDSHLRCQIEASHGEDDFKSQRDQLHVSRRQNKMIESVFRTRNDQFVRTAKIGSKDLKKGYQKNNLQNQIKNYDTPRYQKQNQSLQLNLQKEINYQNATQTTALAKKLQKYKRLNLWLKEQTEHLRNQIYQLRNVEISFEQIKIYTRRLQQEIQAKSLQISEQFAQVSQQNVQNQRIGAQLQQKSNELVEWIQKSQKSSLIISKLHDKIQTLQSKYNQTCIEKQQSEIISQKNKLYGQSVDDQMASMAYQMQKLRLECQQLEKQLQMAKNQVIQWIGKVQNSQKRIRQFQRRIQQTTILNQKESESWLEKFQKIQLKAQVFEQEVSQRSKEIKQLKISNQHISLQLQKQKTISLNLSQQLQVSEHQLRFLKHQIQTVHRDCRQKQNNWTVQIQKAKQIGKKSLETQIKKTDLQFKQKLSELKRQNHQNYILYQEKCQVLEEKNRICQEKNKQIIIQLRQANNSLMYDISQFKLADCERKSQQSHICGQNMRLKAQIQNTKEEILILISQSNSLSEQIKKINHFRLHQNNVVPKQLLKHSNVSLYQQIESRQQQKTFGGQNYCPKKWFQEKITYEYKINTLSNQIEFLNDKVKQYQSKNYESYRQNVKKALLNSPPQFNLVFPPMNVQTSKTKFQSELQHTKNEFVSTIQSQKQQIIKKMKFISHLETQNKELSTKMQNQKDQYEVKFEKLFRDQEKTQEDLEKRLKLQKQLNQDLTMDVILKQNQIKDLKGQIKRQST